MLRTANMSEYEKHADEEGEYLQNIEHFEDGSIEIEKDLPIQEVGRNFGGRDCDVEESIGERFLGLTEMFPASVRESTVRFATFMEQLVKKSYSCACKFWWTTFVMTAIVFSPIVYEYERTREEERCARRCTRGQGPNVAMTS